jgi:branched-chain amino acid transport system substrate-binding protein
MKPILAAVVLLAATPSLAQAQTVYSSLPLSGPGRASAAAVNTGARLALQQSGNAAVRFVALNDATKKAGSWTPEKVSADARKAAGDPATIAYIGEFNSGATKIALPILNDSRIAMISPSNTYTGLTREAPGTEPGEPFKYYPRDLQNYFRLLPNDIVQAAALATAMHDQGCTKIGVLNDGESYGRGLAAGIRATAKRLNLKVVLNRRSGRRAPRALRKADCMAYAGITANGAVRIFKTAPKRLKLFAGDGVAESRFTAHLPASVARRTLITVATLSSESYGLKPGTDPYQAFGYEAMKLILDGLNASGGTRAGLLGWLPTVQNRQSVLGTYGFDANGDTTLRTYGLYTVRGHALRFAGAVNAA